MAIATVVMRASSLLAQLILGRLLLPEQFGIFAIALSFVAVAASLRSVLRPYLVDLLNIGGDFERFYRQVMWTVVGLTLLAVGAAPVLARSFEGEHMAVLLASMFVTVPLQVQPVFGLAKLNQEMAFEGLGRTMAFGIVVRQIATIAGALVGWGVLAFPFGVLAGSLYEMFAVRGIVGAGPRFFGPIGPQGFGVSSRPVRWLPLGVVALAIWVNGDYAVAGWFQSATVVGLYYFAYQLTGALTQPFSMAASSVVVPTFAGMNEPARVRRSYVETMGLLVLIAGLPFGLLAVTVTPIIHTVWGGRWDDAALATVVLALAVPITLVHSVSLSIVQARGLWRQYSLLVLTSAGVTVGAAVLGGLQSGLPGLVITVAIVQSIAGVSVACWVGRSLGVPVHSTLRALGGSGWPFGLGLMLAGLIEPLSDVGWTAAMARSMVFTLATLPILYVVAGERLGELVESWSRR